MDSGMVSVGALSGLVIVLICLFMMLYPWIALGRIWRWTRETERQLRAVNSHLENLAKWAKHFGDQRG